MRRLYALGVLLLPILALGCESRPDEVPVSAGVVPTGPTGTVLSQVSTASGDIVQTIAQDTRLTTLATAVQTAGLTTALQGQGPFTVFAPTNQAFEQLPAGVLTGLLNDPQALARVLQGHVVSGRLAFNQLVANSTLTPLAGPRLTLANLNGQLIINPGTSNATIAETNIPATNGVIHVINAVLVPPAR